MDGWNFIATLKIGTKYNNSIFRTTICAVVYRSSPTLKSVGKYLVTEEDR